jgi:hypothetical protein
MSDDQNSTSQHEEQRGYGAAVILGLLLVFGLLAAPFLPLVLAMIEGVTMGTNKVEDCCREIGIHDELSVLYEAVFALFR